MLAARNGTPNPRGDSSPAIPVTMSAQLQVWIVRTALIFAALACLGTLAGLPHPAITSIPISIMLWRWVTAIRGWWSMRATARDIDLQQADLMLRLANIENASKTAAQRATAIPDNPVEMFARLLQAAARVFPKSADAPLPAGLHHPRPIRHVPIALLRPVSRQAILRHVSGNTPHPLRQGAAIHSRPRSSPLLSAPDLAPCLSPRPFLDRHRGRARHRRPAGQLQSLRPHHLRRGLAGFHSLRPARLSLRRAPGR